MARTWRFAAILFFASALWRPQHTRADDSLADALNVEAGATCLSTALLIEHIETWLSNSPLPRSLTIAVHGSPLFARVVWFEVIHDGVLQAERRFEPGPARCEDLHAALGLTIALAIKASLLDTSQQLGRNALRSAWSLAVDGWVITALVPGVAGGLGVHIAYALSRSLSVRVGALALYGPDGTLQKDDSRMRSLLAAGQLELCAALFSWRHGQLADCMGTLIGELWARGTGFDSDRTTHSFFLDLTNSARLQLVLNAAWSLQLAVGIATPLLRTRFVVRDPSGNITDARELAAVGGFVSIGPAYRF